MNEAWTDVQTHGYVRDETRARLMSRGFTAVDIELHISRMQDMENSKL